MTTRNIEATENETLVQVQNLKKTFASRESRSIISNLFGTENELRAVDGVDFVLKKGEIMGLAGQSGCGKSTLGELLVALQNPTSGKIYFDGVDLASLSGAELKSFRQRAQVIFQDPYEAMNPRFPVARFVAEPLNIHNIGNRESRDAKVIETLEEVGLAPADQYLDNLPGELSGGERQRVCIARALVLNPDFLVADEPVSMLDVSVRTGILHLFKRLKRERDITILYVSHDLSTINYLTDRTMIMYLGKVVEAGLTEDIIDNPSHPYTEALLNSVPDPNPEATRKRGGMKGQVPSPINIPSGCRFHPRCEYADETCLEKEPPLDLSNNSSRGVACHYPLGDS